MSINGHVKGADKQGRKSRVADQQTELEDEQATPVGGPERGRARGRYTPGLVYTGRERDVYE